MLIINCKLAINEVLIYLNTPDQTAQGLYLLNEIKINNDSLKRVKINLEFLLLNGKTNYQIITFNLDFLRISYSDEYFHQICKNNNFVFPDGMGIVFLIWLKYRKTIQRVTGTDLFNYCFDLANLHSLKIALVGSTEKTLSLLSKNIDAKWPNVKFKALCPKYAFEKDNDINRHVIEELKSYGPDILLVALGCPRQEKWILTNKEFIGAKLNIGVGAVFEFSAGTRKRAPYFIQSIGLEWLWRLIQEPVRLGRRYIIKDLPFFFKEAIKVKLGS